VTRKDKKPADPATIEPTPAPARTIVLVALRQADQVAPAPRKTACPEAKRAA